MTTTGTERERRSLASLEAELFDATAHLESCRAETSRARNRECDAMNRVNRLQKAIGDHLDQLKKSAPRDTDWKSTRGLPA